MSRTRSPAPATLGFLVFGLLLFAGEEARAQSAIRKVPPEQQKTSSPDDAVDPLKQFNASLQALVARISPAVVEIRVTGFGPVEESENRTALVGRQNKEGSGVIVDPEGYIITNAHVVEDARSIEVMVSKPQQNDSPENTGESEISYPAHLVGLHKETDLALLKIDATALPYLPVDPKRPIAQGQLVFALGNPEGLGKSVTMGVVSAVDRQPDPKLPMVFIQTDAPINPGNSGGPLVDVDGYVVGINTFIFTESGGSEGLGFAIPSRVVSFVLERLKKFGHVDRSEIGAAAEAITPLLAKGLQLPVTKGVILVDVRPGGPAASAGLQAADIVQEIDSKKIRSLPQLAASLYLHPTDAPMLVSVLRGNAKLTVEVPVLAQKHDLDRLVDLVDPQKNLVRKIGVLAIDVDRSASVLPDLRIKSGVVVVANTAYSRVVGAGVRAGDVIHAVNTKPITSLAELRKELTGFHAGDAIVLQVERSDGMDYVAFEIE